MATRWRLKSFAALWSHSSDSIEHERFELSTALDQGCNPCVSHRGAYMQQTMRENKMH